MRFTGTALLVSALTAFSIAPVLADPTSDISQMRKSFAALHSVHAEMTSKNGSTVSLDMVQPNKYRVSTRGMQMVIIGATQWYNMRGQWRVVPMPKAAQTQMDFARRAGFDNLMPEYTITDAGMDTVRGISAHKYHLVNKKDGNTLDVWGSNNLPVRIVSRGATIDYSQYNSVADITPPM